MRDEVSVPISLNGERRNWTLSSFCGKNHQLDGDGSWIHSRLALPPISAWETVVRFLDGRKVRGLAPSISGQERCKVSSRSSGWGRVPSEEEQRRVAFTFVAAKRQALQHRLRSWKLREPVCT